MDEEKTVCVKGESKKLNTREDGEIAMLMSHASVKGKTKCIRVYLLM